MAPAPSAEVTAAPPVDPSGTPSAAPAAPPVARKECSKIAAMASPEEPHFHVLAQPGSCWSIIPAEGDPLRDIVIEAYDARRVDDADVARLRVTYNGPSGPEDISERAAWPQQVAVGQKGVWFASRKDDDKAINAAMQKPPTYALPPKPAEPSKAGKWRFLRKGTSPKGEVACFGFELPKDECKENCSATICTAVVGGIVSASGAATPTGGAFAQKGIKVEMSATKKP
ncbi:MAG: hypothetical protein U0359_31885 [Byssovorax sp.]